MLLHWRRLTRPVIADEKRCIPRRLAHKHSLLEAAWTIGNHAGLGVDSVDKKHTLQVASVGPIRLFRHAIQRSNLLSLSEVTVESATVTKPSIHYYAAIMTGHITGLARPTHGLSIS